MSQDDRHVVAVTGIVIKDGKYLITKRAMNKRAFPGKWTLPGGRLEVVDYKDLSKDTGEHWYNVLERVLKREVKEEVGLEIKNIKYLTNMTFIKYDDIPVLVMSLYADYDFGEVVLNEESEDYAWVSLEEARNYDLIEGIYDELVMLDRDLKSGRAEGLKECFGDVFVKEKKKVGVGFGVMMLREGKVLLGRRHSDKDKADSELRGEGTWTMPGGKLEYGEDFEEGARREVLEETGIKLGNVRVISFSNDKNQHAHFVTGGFFSEDFEGEPRVMEPDEIVEWNWFSLDNLPNPLFFPSKRILELYNKNLFYKNFEIKERNVVEEIRKFVEEECRKPCNKYSFQIYTNHILLVLKYSRILAKKLNADLEIVEIAALLHDIGLISGLRENHHITGSEIAEKKLKELGYDEDKIKKVKHCIFSHRGSRDIFRESVEAQIIADADSMCHFDDIKGLFYVCYGVSKLNQNEAGKKVYEKLINSYNKLSDEAKEIVKPKFEAAKLLLGGGDENRI